jgi:Spy/CpxP family protein refolding chaperone
MKRTSRWLAAAALFTGFARVAVAGGPDGGPPPFGMHGPPPIDRILERHAAELGLSDDVRARVRAIAADAEKQEAPLRETARTQRETLHQLLSQDSPDPDAVMRQADIAGAAETELRKERLRTLLAVRQLLTPEQRAQLVKIFEEKRRQMGGRWHMPPPDAALPPGAPPPPPGEPPGAPPEP